MVKCVENLFFEVKRVVLIWVDFWEVKKFRDDFILILWFDIFWLMGKGYFNKS